jgi:hypothetical protein
MQAVKTWPGVGLAQDAQCRSIKCRADHMGTPLPLPSAGTKTMFQRNAHVAEPNAHLEGLTKAPARPWFTPAGRPEIG